MFLPSLVAAGEITLRNIGDTDVKGEEILLAGEANGEAIFLVGEAKGDTASMVGDLTIGIGESSRSI